jgi:putative nucleotidyltransferase with HDIG domain
MDAATYVKRVGKLPSLSSLYYELTRAVEDPNASISMIGDIVRKDPGLASRLLKLANSAYYSFPSEVQTIEEALQLIGLREMRDMALATCVIGAFKNVPERLVKVADFWRHCIACGVASSLLAETRKEPTPERFFVGGLLHDVGRLVMYLTAPAESEQILRLCESEKNVSCVIETRILGFDHAELGAELLTAWKIPPTLIAMVGHHHYPGLFPASTRDDLVVHFADFIVTAMEFGSSGELYLLPLFADTAKRCPLADGQLESIIHETEARSDQLCSILTDSVHANP